jgi:hypothetical protein
LVRKLLAQRGSVDAKRAGSRGELPLVSFQRDLEQRWLDDADQTFVQLALSEVATASA